MADRDARTAQSKHVPSHLSDDTGSCSPCTRKTRNRQAGRCFSETAPQRCPNPHVRFPRRAIVVRAQKYVFAPATTWRFGRDSKRRLKTPCATSMRKMRRAGRRTGGAVRLPGAMAATAMTSLPREGLWVYSTAASRAGWSERRGAPTQTSVTSARGRCAKDS